MKRSGKFYRKNEAEIMRDLGLSPTKNSGSGWIEKEDGVNEDTICQLKSTDGNSIKINKQDLDTLKYHAIVEHKIPVFAIQFINSNEVFLVVKPEDITDLDNYINVGIKPENNLIDIDLKSAEQMEINSKIVKSSSDAREDFKKEIKNQFRKGLRSAT